MAPPGLHALRGPLPNSVPLVFDHVVSSPLGWYPSLYMLVVWYPSGDTRARSIGCLFDG